MLLVIVMYALFGSVFTVGKYTLQFVDPYFLTGVRMLIAGGILLPFCRQKKFKHFWLILGLGVFNVFITNAFEFWALQYMISSKAALIYSLSPFFSILLSYLFYKEKMSAGKWVGLCIGLLGFIPLFLNPSAARALSLPDLAVAISAFTAVVGWLCMKQIMHKHGYSFLTANMYSFFIGGVLSLLCSPFLDPWDPLPLHAWKPMLLGVLYISIIHNVICYNIYGYCIRRFSVSFMMFAGFTNPLFAALWGKIFLKETVDWSFFVSLAVIIFGIYLYSRQELKRPS
ncbi:MAG: EamA family transporter [Chlamydiales bacterium]|nr:EamA family transporter [Chlamydiales bacterium]